ncbi:MAG: hypothetical protein QNJ54_28125 [Prochloraceae cyanobacterium]|nr:hypothetical protein [Prochloraceae cyanobacterium]
MKEIICKNTQTIRENRAPTGYNLLSAADKTKQYSLSKFSIAGWRFLIPRAIILFCDLEAPAWFLERQFLVGS